MTDALTPAERILYGLGIRHPCEIDLEAIAASRGAFVKYQPLDNCEAMIAGSSKRAVILVNSNSCETRQRFSLAHELGHWHHHRGKVLYCSSDEVEETKPGPLNPERQADGFASDLVLPTYMFRPIFAKLKRFRIQEAAEIAAEFNVSLTATLIKCVELNRLPIILACYRRSGYSWSRPAKMVPSWWRLHRTLDRETFAGRMLFDGASPEAWPRKMPADAWFDFRGAGDYEVQEQSVMLPGAEVLTILTIPENGLG
ncbi:Zn-dependent peptidase ImmA (M78 family) [Rhodoblastus acidophilus]|uniref:ImmA/IrrE family metallo-endopeptidase n=1 Tax=Rhodoblastus acidophilus TaxID=1074 RepID=UPI002224127A|nr:ImmA/IrrE family metallo-endopeptidase [Rhodoblastus acidophilus]MCW2282570.1 Zn-dependent peptidase ImmA (M78 family) [Rhodoblastus acidophilus]MCW2331431.1 Zn-dependent peptidase ImmA (M78 family) [Rhodoblastus acidophilus]